MPGPDVRDLASAACVAVRLTVPMAEVDIGALVGEHLPRVAGRLPTLGLAIAGPPYVRYHAWGHDLADVELGFPVAGPVGALPALAACTPGEMGATSLPGGRAAVLVHVGPYTDLPAAYTRLDDWCRTRGLHPAGGPWESYVDNPDVVPPASLRTDVVFPLTGDA
jgi:AraC family transcriptional regulator